MDRDFLENFKKTSYYKELIKFLLQEYKKNISVLIFSEDIDKLKILQGKTQMLKELLYKLDYKDEICP